MRGNSALRKISRPNHFLSDTLPIGNVQNQITDQNTITKKRRKYHFCGTTVHNRDKHAQKQAEGGGDSNRKNMQITIQLDWKIR